MGHAGAFPGFESEASYKYFHLLVQVTDLGNGMVFTVIEILSVFLLNSPVFSAICK